MTDRELMQMALDALDLLCRYEHPATKIQVRKPRDGGPIVTIYPHKVATEAAAPLRARLAQPEQEPVAWMSQGGDVSRSRKHFKEMGFTNLIPLYTAPPQREWQGLTDEEIWTSGSRIGLSDDGIRKFAREIEAKLKEKNT